MSAAKSRDGLPSLARPYPITSCEEPYIGEESIIRPPASKKLRITSAQASRATRSLPTLKVIQLPNPTTGNASPLDGIGRVSRGFGWADPSIGRSAVPAPSASSERRTLRRSTSGKLCTAPSCARAVALRHCATAQFERGRRLPCARQGRWPRPTAGSDVGRLRCRSRPPTIGSMVGTLRRRRSVWTWTGGRISDPVPASRDKPDLRRCNACECAPAGRRTRR